MALFFFSSRRRHTRSKRDWSSDVCSSDLPDFVRVVDCCVAPFPRRELFRLDLQDLSERSEERRVGKECRSPGAGREVQTKGHLSLDELTFAVLANNHCINAVETHSKLRG